MKTREELLTRLNSADAFKNLKTLIAAETLPPVSRDVNNHIHTTYSFSPYSPTAAVWFARSAGLCTCGLMDHDSIAGAEEFIAAAREIGMGSTIGIECRVSFKNTPFGNRRINNPDQDSIVYMALHGVPHDKAAEVNAFFAPYRAFRNERNVKMVAAVNELMGQYGVTIDFEKDVLPLSNYEKGGSVTERHISSALAYRMLDVIGKGESLVSFIRETMKLPVSDKIAGFLCDAENPHMMYDLLGWIKSTLIARFYIDATDECPDVTKVLALSEKVGAISAYAYLGDVGDSVTGDKRAQKFEDDYLDELIAYIAGLGYRAVTYMPSRNTTAQLDRLRALCEKYDLFQISGEDINSPRQSFVCEAQRAPAFKNLYDATWALIAHEWLATEDPAKGFFAPAALAAYPKLTDRVKAYAEKGQALTW